MWSKWFFGGVLPAITGLLLGQGRACASDDASVGVVLDGVGYTRRLWIREGGEIVVRATVVSGLEALVRDRLSPVVEALADASGASRNVFWSNAGNTLEYLIGEMARHPSITPSTLHDAYGFLDTRRLGDGERNPLFRPVRYRQVAGEGNPVERTRRACCIRYLLPEMSYCANCPLNCAARSGERDQRRAAGTTRREGVA
jgi:ferric iron reductase protein FhuF